jgi:hypothetical protein
MTHRFKAQIGHMTHCVKAHIELLAGQDGLPAVLDTVLPVGASVAASLFLLRLAVDLPLWIAFRDDKPQSALQG